MTTREWYSIQDPDDPSRTWAFDVTFLTSSWRCIYGAGCQGVLDDPAPELMQGCCSHGAYAADKQDRKRVEAIAPTVDPSIWQFHEHAGSSVFERIEKGEWRTKLVDDACIFLNRPGFDGPIGCALHHHADQAGIHFSEVKPEVCWQLPIRRVDTIRDDDTVLSEIGEFSRAAWGEGGSDFAWWCTEAPEAFDGSSRVYQTMREELIGLVGEPVLKELTTYLDQRYEEPSRIQHPVEVEIRLLSSAERSSHHQSPMSDQ